MRAIPLTIVCCGLIYGFSFVVLNLCIVWVCSVLERRANSGYFGWNSMLQRYLEKYKYVTTPPQIESNFRACAFERGLQHPNRILILYSLYNWIQLLVGNRWATQFLLPSDARTSDYQLLVARISHIHTEFCIEKAQDCPYTGWRVGHTTAMQFVPTLLLVPADRQPHTGWRQQPLCTCKHVAQPGPVSMCFEPDLYMWKAFFLNFSMFFFRIFCY